MAIKKTKKRFEISMEKEAYELITKFSEAHHMSKSEFIVCCCMKYINAICKAYDRKDKKGE